MLLLLSLLLCPASTSEHKQELLWSLPCVALPDSKDAACLAFLMLAPASMSGSH